VRQALSVMHATRAGLSLIECLIALVILTIGVSATSAVLLTALRVERNASMKLDVTRVASAHLTAFVSAPCPIRDSAWARNRVGGIREQWAIVVEDSGASLIGSVEVIAPPAPHAVPLAVRRRCA